MHRKVKIPGYLLAFVPGFLQAQQPLNIQQLLVDDARWQMLGMADYRMVRDRSGVARQQQQLSAALRYGVGPRLEFNAQLRTGDSQQDIGSFSRSEQYRDVSLGANWLMKGEGAWPALLIEGRTQLYSRFGAQSQPWSSAEVTLTAYQSVDPLVLSLSAGLVARRDYSEGNASISPGFGWSIAPQVNFAVNHRVTLIGGLSFTRREADRINGLEIGQAQQDIGWRLGLGYAPQPDDTLFIVGDFTSDSNGGSISLQWFHAF